MSTVTVNATATTATACGCCGTLEAATLQCRTRGGTAVLCGYEEFASPSTPPKKYRRVDRSGGYFFQGYTSASCTTTDPLTIECDYYGFCEYNENTCIENAQGFVDCGLGPVAQCTNALGSDGGRTEVVTATTRSWTPTGNCFFNGTAWGRYTSLTALIALSVEDTNEDAITRLLAGAGGTWGSWLTPGASGCAGTPPPCCLARWEERTSDFDFVYVESEYRVTASGLLPSTGYSARVEIYRSVFGANTFSLFQTLIVSGTTDGSGNFSEDGAVPNEEGFESYAAAAYIVIPP